MLRVNIDGDSIVYKSGFASDTNLFKIDNGSVCITVNHIKEAKEICNEMGFPHDIITHEVEPEPLKHCLHTVKQTLQQIVSVTRADDYTVFLSGKGNYRNDIATLQKYKGSRDKVRRPHWYAEIRDYLVNVHLAVVSKDEEADDMLGYMQTEDTIVAHLDKDIDMIPGKHYNWQKNLLYTVEEIDGLRCFYKQLITGDTTDDIPGLSEKAPKKRTFKVKPLDNMTTEKEMYDYVFEGYAMKFCDDAEKYLLEQGRLLWIRREPEQLWTLPYSL
jgi:hypothetical protein